MPITPLPESRAKLCLNVVRATETAVAKSEATFASISGRDRVSARARAVQLDASPQFHAPRSIGPARRLSPIPFLANSARFVSTVCMTSGGHGFLNQPRENEVRVIERDGKRWLQQWRMPPEGHFHQRAWVDVAELPWPPSNVRAIRPRT